MKNQSENHVFTYRQENSNNGPITSVANATRKETQPMIQDKRHLVALQFCFTIVIIFIISYASLILKVTLKSTLPLQYVYALNHICNPFVYYMFNKNFRKDVSAMNSCVF